MKLNTFFQVCIYITFCMIIFNAAFAFVAGAGFFKIEDDDPTYTGGPGTGDNSSETVSNIMVSPENPEGLVMNNIWAMLIGGGAVALAGSLILAWLTHSTILIGIYLYSVTFWATYINTLSIINIGDFLLTSSILPFVAIGTVGMIFLFIASLIGMLTGSG